MENTGWKQGDCDLKGILRLQASGDGLRWPLVRVCSFPTVARYLVGPTCCTPESAGLRVVFSDFTVAVPKRQGFARPDLTKLMCAG
jgi:regulation of enolase protein 1 (concanavalin A-like superfamily)